VTCRHILDFFVENSHLSIPRDESNLFLPKEFASASRMVRRWVKNKAGTNKNDKRTILFPSQKSVAKKHLYPKTLLQNRAHLGEERLREVYTGESYIHQHRNDESILHVMMSGTVRRPNEKGACALDTISAKILWRFVHNAPPAEPNTQAGTREWLWREKGEHELYMDRARDVVAPTVPQIQWKSFVVRSIQ
jgi:hypothetical protein